ncbi:MAG: DHH family phosphoesterase, partial [Paludibacteraceae bacterium]|nr:DHH family phosphoesterase [Paludibacteraceae bacterium]
MILPKFTEKQVEKVAQMFQRAERVVILTHMSPDGDAMGSSLGMKHALLSTLNSQTTLNSKLSTLNVIVPNAFPSFLQWMPGAEEDLIYEKQAAEADALLEQADLIILTDFHEPKRIGSLGEKLLQVLDETKDICIIDHHLSTIDVDATFAAARESVFLIYPDSPSASELVYRLFYQLSTLNSQLSTTLHSTLYTLNLDAATCLYTGMMTDTGNFSFNSNYPEMYEIVGQLVAAGVNKDAIYNKVFNQYSADRMRLMGYCLYQKMRVFPEHHTALIYLSRKELYRFNFQSGDGEGLVNLPLQISDVYYSVFMREDKVNPSEVSLANGSKIKVKISLR